MRLKARWDLFLYQERAPETISFSPYQNTAQLVSVGYILRCSRREMSVCCKAAGQEHDRKNEDQPARHSTLSKITHNQREYVSPRANNVKLVISAQRPFLLKLIEGKRYASLTPNGASQNAKLGDMEKSRFHLLAIR
jgi:hypothetical protein